MKKKSNNGALGQQLSSGLSTVATGRTSVPKSTDVRANSINGPATRTSIAFGKESKAAQGTTSTSSSSELSNFLSSTLTRGLTGSSSSVLGSSSVLNASGLGSLGSLVSGLLGLFGGGNSKPAPLPAFSLPGSEIQNIKVRTDTSTATGTATQSAGTYGELPDSALSGSSLANQNQQIAQAVKTALLQSHSLADVITEL